MSTMRLLPSVLLFVLAGAAARSAVAQQGYRLPPQAVVDLVDAPPAPSVQLSPDTNWMLFVESSALPSIADLSRPMLRLAGTRIDPAANARYSTDFGSGLLLRARDGGEARRVPLGDGARLASVSWSHDSRHFVYVLSGTEGSQLYVVSVDAPERPRLLTDRLCTVTDGVTWMPDGRKVLCHLVPEGRGAEPVQPRTPTGPNTSETSGDTSPLRTYQDLLASAHDEALFEHYATTQLALIDVDGGEPRTIGNPAIFAGARPSPDGRRLLVTFLKRPYSYLMPWSSFPQTIVAWDLAGQEGPYFVAEVPLAENIPLGGVRLGPRSVQWNPHADAELLWVEALDGGDPKQAAPARDRWLRIAAPFPSIFDANAEGPTELVRVEQRARGLDFLQDPDLFITGEYDRDRRWVRDLLYDRTQPDVAPRVLDDRSAADRYGDPGRLVTETNERGESLVRVDGGRVYRTGSGASPEGLLPFLDAQDLATLATERLWRCAPGAYESVSELLPSEEGAALCFVTRFETPTSPPNLHLRTVGSEESQVLTEFPDPTPQLRGIHKELVTYARADGVPLSATLYLPADYVAGTQLPLLIWAYPREFNDPGTAGQVSASPWRFTRVSGLSHLVLLTQGYAILDDATMPVVGDPETMNDTFVAQIVAAAQAAIDYAVERGVADRERVFVGGHSYGAFMTANLLAHCDLFAAGVARSGAYNRTLTPFGFQSERRTFWEAPDAYFAVSPFMHADGIDEPLLLIHGEIDNNSGTFPVQSERLFQALKGNGGTARLVMLPNESHGYRARESVLHVHAETIEWFGRAVDPGN